MKNSRQARKGIGRLRTCAYAALCLCALLPLHLLTSAAEVPLKFTYQGNLRQGGFLANGTRNMVFRIYGSASAPFGSQLWTSPEYAVDISTGVFQVALEPSLAAWQGGGLWLELQVENNRLAPREEITASPYAINSALHSGKRYTTAPTAPASPGKGDLWMNTSLNALYFWNGSGWTSTAGSGAAHAASHAGGAVDAITEIGAHSVTGDITVAGGVSFRSAGAGVLVSTNLVVTGALNPSSGLTIGGAGYTVIFASSVHAGVFSGSRLNLAGAPGSDGDVLTVSTGGASGIRVTGAGEIYAGKFYGDGSALTGLGSAGGGDNLGDHVATTTLRMGNKRIFGSGAATMSSFTATGTGVEAAQLRLNDAVTVALEGSAALGSGVRVSSNVYIVGIASAAKYYGDGSGLTGLGVLSDNLGDHTATTDLKLGGNRISGLGTMTMSSFTATGTGVRAAQLRLASGVTLAHESSPALGAGVRVSSNVYIVGYSSAVKYYGDGSGLTGLAIGGDNLGDHAVTADLRLGANQLTGLGAATMSSFTATGAGLSAAQLRLAEGVTLSEGGGLRLSSHTYIVGFSSAAKYYGDGSALTGMGALSDDMGDHTATTNLRLGAYRIAGQGAATMSSFTATGLGLGAAQLRLAAGVAVSSETSAALGAGVRVSTNIYVVGYSSAAKYYGDGSALTGLTDNLGDHTATADLKLGVHGVTGYGAMTMSSFTAAGAGLSAAQLRLADSVLISSESSAALGGGVRVSSNIYIVGFSSAARYYGDGSALTGVTIPGDNLGSHVAATDLKLGAYRLGGQGSATMSSFTATGQGLRAPQLLLADSVAISSESSAALGGGVRVSSNIYIVGFSSATRYYGDGSALTGLTALADNLGNHTATADLRLGANRITGLGAMTMSSFTATGAGLSAAQLRLADSVLISSESSAALGAGVRVSSNIYTAGSVTAARFYGDGTSLTGMAALSDSLGNHTATKDLDLNGFNIVNVGGINILNGAGLRINGAAEAGKYLRGNDTNFVPTGIQPVDLPVTTLAPYVLDTGDTMTGQLTLAGSTLTVTGAEGIWSPKLYFGDGLSLSYATAEAGAGVLSSTYVYTRGLGVSSYGELQTRGIGRGTTAGNPRGIGAVDLQVKRSAATKAATGAYSAIAGGQDNTASGDNSVVSGGSQNMGSGQYSAVGGGANTASGSHSMAPGGLSNTAAGDYSFAVGRSNTASGESAFAAGVGAQASAAGTFTWGDSLGTMLDNNVLDRVRFKARGGFMVSGSTAAAEEMTGFQDRAFIVTGNGLVGIAKAEPEAALDVVATGDGPAVMAAIWRNASGTIVSSVSATGIIRATRFVGDSSGITGVPSRANLTMTLPLLVDNYVQIGSFDSPSGMHNLYVSVSVVSGFSIARQYALPIFNNMTDGNWRVVLPLTDTGPAGGNDFILEVSVMGTITQLRVRRTAGSTPATAVINVEQMGSSDDVFTPDSSADTAPEVYPLLPVAALTQTRGLAGVGTASPRSRFDVADGSITVRGDSAGFVLENASRVIAPEFSPALGAGVRVSTNVYVIGFASATSYYGDGSGLINTFDHLGSHTATRALNMSGWDMANISSAVITGAGVSGAAPLFQVKDSVMAALNDGKVGLGTLTPATRLHLADIITDQYLGEAAGSGQLRLDNAAASLAEIGGIEFKITGASDGSGSKIQAINSGGSQLLFAGRQAGGVWTEHMRIAATGNVGIGTNNPASRLSVQSAGPTFASVTGTGDSGFAVTNSAGARTWNTYVDNAGYYRVDRVGGGAEFAIDTAGRTGVATASPATTLDVNGALTARAESAGSQAFRAVGRAADNASWAPLAYRSDAASPTGGMLYAPAAVVLSTGSPLTPVMAWLASGNVGIGTTSPAARLDVGGTGAFKVPVGSTAQRPAAPLPGMLRFNSDSGTLEYYYNSAWNCVGGVFATGGDIAAGEIVGSYRVHRFTSPGTLNVVCGGAVEYLVVAGGGAGGGGWQGGGGGAGGLRTGFLSVSPGAKTVAIGAGGAGGGTPSANSGGVSTFDSITAQGGGYGAAEPFGGSQDPANGGSGGGGSHGSFGGPLTVGTGAAGEGNSGGRGISDPTGVGFFVGGGGGGSAMPGRRAGYTRGGGGGLGVLSPISGSFTYYAGGGGGTRRLGAAGAGGYGGGGAGGATGVSGTPNTGGGGGSGTGNLGVGVSGAGGSGVVVVRYPIVDKLPVPTVTAVSPFFGPGTGGTVITITGTNFAANNVSVLIGSIPATGVIWDSATQVRATTPGSVASGPRTVTVMNLPYLSYGQKAGGYIYMAAATGGTIDDVSAPGYRIHKFTTTGANAFNVLTGGDMEVLVVAGGGGGGGWGGGGGAGGLVYDPTVPLGKGNYTLTVGGGGARGTSAYTAGANGTNSILDAITAVGGGGGGYWDTHVGLAGGSGGGGSNAAGGAGTPGQGNAGGAGGGNTPSGYHGHGGGGGAGGAGANFGFFRGGPGGIGLRYAISGAPVYYAGGGGGHTPGYAGFNTVTAAGGPGGGGAGGNYAAGGTPIHAQSGTANTGGGGGGCWGGVGCDIGDGGSGVIIVKYPIDASLWPAAPAVTGVSPAFGRGGTPVTLTGSNFAAGAEVTIGGAAAQATTVNSGQITAIVPFLTSIGPKDIVVTNPGVLTGGQSATLAGAFTATVYATGGFETDSGKYRVHTFYGSDTLKVTTPGLAETLVVGGGGGGGMDMGGGGGGGAVISSTITLTAGNLAATVGGGGAGAPAASTNGQPAAHQYTIRAVNGQSSVFSGLTAIGGGYGASSYQDYTPDYGAGGAGASGGGATTYSPSARRFGGAGTAGQRYRGGFSYGSGYYGGGGGGANGDGADGPNLPVGGPGLLNPIMGADYYWGGGGGASGYSACGGNGGIGGGGGGSICATTGGAGVQNGFAGGGGAINVVANTPGGAGGASTGGGGGGGSHYTANNNGGNGGSGIVVVRYSTDAALWTAAPTLDSVSPDVGSGKGGYVVTLTGSNFSTPAKVTIGGIAAQATTVDPQHIRAVVPPLPASGILDIVVINPDGQSVTLARAFTATVYAIGGIESDSGGYHIHKFNATEAFRVVTGGNVEALVVAGGGGGGGDVGGGGGAGGLVYNSDTAITNQIYTVTIGGGGAGGAAAGSNGANSIFASVTALGGGGGGGWSALPGLAGGSGGGSTSNLALGGGAATAGQGYPGGHGANNPGGTNDYSGCGGGGGAGHPGGNGAINWTAGSTTSGFGGNGLQFDISGALTYYAGGGGAASNSLSYWGVGGLGGGGRGGTGYPGTANTGGGGGGGNGTGSNGGTGVVIVRYSTDGTLWKATPVLDSVSPVSGRARTIITLTGSNFAKPAHVTIGGIRAVATTLDSQHISVVVPIQASVGPKDVVVTNPGGESVTLVDGFTATVSAIGGVETDAGGYHIHTFTDTAGIKDAFTVDTGGTVQVDAWGGGGAGGTVGGWVYGSMGGAGGAANGLVTVDNSAVYPVIAGGGGGVNGYGTGFLGAVGNGGPASNNGTGNTYAGAGGGFSGLFLTSVSQANARIVAGGGGGGGSSRAGPGNPGGAGGGSIAQRGFSTYDGKTGYAGNPGTQAGAGADASCDSANAPGGQGALQGGVVRINGYGGGGGGGYWGGSAGGYSEPNTMAGGGGGSSYFNPSYVSAATLTSGGGGAAGDASNPLRGSAGNAGVVAGNAAAGKVVIRYSTDATLWKTAPDVTGVSPATGHHLGGYTLTLTGTNFAPGAAVTIGGVAANAVTVNATQITAVMPALAAGAKDIVVTNPGSAADTLTGQFTVFSNLVVARGGTEYDSGLYHVHRYTNHVDEFEVYNGGNVEVLVVAGGGGGGSDMGGGGGGGGVLAGSSYAVTTGENTLTIGLGGAGAPAGISQVRGYSGTNSIFGTLTALGGGGGGSEYSVMTSPAGNGGSGGGCSAGAMLPSSGYGGARGLGTPGQGFDGAWGIYSWYAGGGGGAGGPGSTIPGPGGPGFLNTILGTSYYWGGGGGGAGYSACGGNGGIGGGGGGAVCATTGGAGYNNGAAGGGGVINSQTNTPGGAAGANTGGGGGGGAHYNSNNYGGAGASGIIAVRYSRDSSLWNAQPTLTDVTPSSGSGRGGYTITLTGTNFATPAVVTIGGVAAQATTVNSNQITAVVRPLTTAGVLDVVVTNPGGLAATLTGGFAATAFATGGVESDAGGYHIHRFTVNDTLKFVTGGRVDLLAVGGGGGSGGDVGAGGGGGGFVRGPYDATGSYSVVIGAGGTNSSNQGLTGGNSVFGSVTALGGGGAGGWFSPSGLAGLAGGSGGGGGANFSYPSVTAAGAATQPGSGSGGFGNVGGVGAGSPAPSYGAGGGGGGAGGPGYPGVHAGANNSTGGRGGDGKWSDLSGAGAYYAAGGPGTNDQGLTGGAGLGGVAINTAGTNGLGAGAGGSQNAGLVGGSGVVIVRYSTDAALWREAPVLGSLSQNTGATRGGYNITLTGSNFAKPAVVTIGGVEAAATTVNSTQITAVVPTLTAGVKDVVVTNPGGQASTLTGGFTAYDMVYAIGGTESEAGGYRIHTFTGAVGTHDRFEVIKGGAVQVDAWGGGGAGGTVGGWAYGSSGGAGGAGSGRASVANGALYQVITGGPGIKNSAVGTGAIGGGAAATNNGTDNQYTGGSGGYSGLFLNAVSQANSVLVAGGGGGGGSSWPYSVNGPGNGGGGGGGVTGQTGYCPYTPLGYAGNPGTQGAAGAPINAGAALYLAGTGGGQGALQGGVTYSGSYGGAGGGGYWGGSAGGYYNANPNNMCGGGGGSGYFNAGSVTGGILAPAAGTIPGDSANALRGTGGTAGVYQGNGNSGKVVIRYSTDASLWAATPDVTGVTPATGRTAGQYTITLTGSNFAKPAAVTIGGIAVNATTVNSTQITFTVPDLGTAGTKNIVVTNPGGQSDTLAGQFTAVDMVYAIGGTEYDSGPYHVHKITGSEAFEVIKGGTVDVLVVGGGGSGGNHNTTNANGGGGGGGVLEAVGFAVTPQRYEVRVGVGGPAVANATNARGSNGANSIFSTLTALGGGGGGGSGAGGGLTGGSGGGGAYYYQTAGAASQPGGFANAGAASAQTWTGAGGGGAGSAGIGGDACSNCSPSGNGGFGFGTDISGTREYYGGGGGGGGNSSERAGDGYAGGGRGEGTTSFYSYAVYPDVVNPITRGRGLPTGVPNTGGGGGGGSYWAVNGNWSSGSGAGGSGVVIIRYAKDPAGWGLAPSLASISPVNGGTPGGYAITLTGSNFSAPASVTIGGVPATQVTTVNSTQITVMAPPLTLGAKDVVVTNQGGQSSTLPGALTVAAPLASCSAIKAAGQSVGDGMYWISPAATPFRAYCDMTTDGGGWTLVANVAPADGNNVGYNNQSFWTADTEFGAFETKFSRDYKSPAAYGVPGDFLMIQSVDTGEAGAIKGWRRWPMTTRKTFDSMFTTGVVGVHATDFCETRNADMATPGTSSSQDEIQRQGSCLYTDVNPSSSGDADLMRLTVLPYNSQDNMMSGYGTCINCGATWQGSAFMWMGIDRAGCATGSCTYAQMCRVGSPYTAADCLGSYCTDATYSTAVCDSLWNSRFFVRDIVPVNTASCKTIFDTGGSTGDGLYTIDPDGAGGNAGFQAYCNMTTNGGGWTLALDLQTSDAGNRHYDDTAFWTTETEYGSVATPFANDFKSKAFSQVPATEMMMYANNNGAVMGTSVYPLTGSAVNKTLYWMFNNLSNATITGARTANTGSVGANARARNDGDMFIDRGYPIILNSTYSPVDSVNVTRLGSNYAASCGVITCGGHNFGGWGGRHYRSTWGAYYEGAAMNGYCSSQGGFGSNNADYTTYNSFTGSGCGGGTLYHDVDMAVFIR